MYYINPTPNETGYYGNPMGQPFPDCLTLPDSLLDPYIEAMGFVTLTVEGAEVVSLETNQEALDAYLAEHPITPPPDPSPTMEDRVTALEQAVQLGLTYYEEDLGNG